MAEPTIVFNNASGSDTAASGAGPASAVSGSAAAHTNGAPSTTITLTNTPDLSGVATDGSHCLWLNTGSGRQFSKITAVDDGADTVTVADSFTIALAGAVDYAIGGKRKTLDNADSRTLFSSTGIKNGWSVSIEDNQSLTSALALGLAATAPIIMSGPSGRATITQTADDSCITGNFVWWKLVNLVFENTNAAKTGANGCEITTATTVPVRFENCIFGHATNQLKRGVTSTTHPLLNLVNCEVKNTTDTGVYNAGASGGTALFGCFVHDCGAGGIYTVGNRHQVYHQTIIADNVGDGIYHNSTALSTAFVVTQCTIHNNGGDGIDLQDVAGCTIIAGSNITKNGGYGVNCFTDFSSYQTMFNFNNFGTGATANALGDYNNATSGDHDLAVDPGYTDAANDDYSVGTNVKALGFPDSTAHVGINSATHSFVDIGAAQREEPVGSSTIVVSVCQSDISLRRDVTSY